MRKHHQPRRLTVGDTSWLWSVRHRHPDCREVLSLHREGAGATLRLVFSDAVPGRYLWDSGGIGNTAGHLNLHEPGVVRGFLDEAAERGLLPSARGEIEIDGWPLFDAVLRR
ncbi:hypothetical protein [Streptomyces sp. NPDC048650]|uniref:hypothetical protein n=1 Tax=unclassified Streptomyces TaxID=2593676 RepID=UPI0037109C43